MVLYTVPDDPMRAGRLRSALAKCYNFEGIGVMTLADYIDRFGVCKSAYTREYSSRKVDMCYKRLATPKREYTIWHTDPRWTLVGIDVPKIVYDAYPLPPREEWEASQASDGLETQRGAGQ